MKILLVGNHPFDGTHSLSMTIFADMLYSALCARGHEVILARPKARLWEWTGMRKGMGKWCKYVEQFASFPFELRRLEKWADIVHICDHSNAPFLEYLSGKPCIVTCHDAIGLKRAQGLYPEERASWMGKKLQEWTARNLRRADRIASVSQTVQRELEELLHLDRSKLSVVYNGLNFSYTPMNEASIERTLRPLGIPLDRPFILHVGSDEWKKNRHAVLEIFAELRRMNHPSAKELIFVGSPLNREMFAYLEQRGIIGDVRAFDKLPSEILCALYSKAELFVFPSLYEGFGWPIIEAQACGCLVVTSNRNPMSEVSGKGALHIDPENPIMAAQNIGRLMPKEWQDIRQLGMDNAKRFSPQSMITEYENLYDAMLASYSSVTASAI